MNHYFFNPVRFFCSSHFSSFTTYYQPLTTNHLLFTTYYLLPTTYYLLPTTYYLLLTTYYQLPTSDSLPLTPYLLPPKISTYQHPACQF